MAPDVLLRADVGRRDVVLKGLVLDSPFALAADLDSPKLTRAQQRHDLRDGDVQNVRHVGGGQEPRSHGVMMLDGWRWRSPRADGVDSVTIRYRRCAESTMRTFCCRAQSGSQ